MRWFLGVDPGASGGVAIIDAQDPRYSQAWKYPETEREINDLFLSLKYAQFAVIEKVHSMPKQGVASSFKFGYSYGFLRGMLIAHRIPFEEVSPQKWQKRMNCLTKGDKNVSKARAQQLFPSMKISHATADALLLAEYCRLEHQGKTDGWEEI